MRVTIAAFLVSLVFLCLASRAFAAPRAALATRHPVVLAHGIMGFRCLQVAGVNFGNYFRGVEEHLARLGLHVHVPVVGMTNGIPERAQRLKAQIDQMVPTGKVNIIAHSLGGLDARYMITHLGMADRVASLTMVGTPHRGTTAADFACETVGQGLGMEALLDELGIEVEAFHELTTQRCEAFNLSTPDQPQVQYFTVGGAQRWWNITPPFMPVYFLMRAKDALRAGRPLESVRLPHAPALDRWRPTLERLIRWEADRVRRAGVDARDVARWQQFQGKNDGMVPLWSTQAPGPWAQIDMDHLDQIGWLSTQDTPVLYETLVRRLISEGL